MSAYEYLGEEIAKLLFSFIETGRTQFSACVVECARAKMSELIDWEADIFTSDPVDTIFFYSRDRETLIIASLTRATYDTLYRHRRVRSARVATLWILNMKLHDAHCLQARLSAAINDNTRLRQEVNVLSEADYEAHFLRTRLSVANDAITDLRQQVDELRHDLQQRIHAPRAIRFERTKNELGSTND